VVWPALMMRICLPHLMQVLSVSERPERPFGKPQLSRIWEVVSEGAFRLFRFRVLPCQTRFGIGRLDRPWTLLEALLSGIRTWRGL
jgi:hypothetical protein